MTAWVELARRFGWIVLLSIVTCASVALVASERQPRIYQARAVLLVDPTQVLPSSNLPQPGRFADIDSMVQVYLDLVNTPPVWKHLIERGVPRTEAELKVGIQATREGSTQSLIVVTSNDRDPRVAQQVATEIIPAFNDSISEFPQGAQRFQLERLTAWDVPTAPPSQPVSPRTTINVGLGAVVGFCIGCLAVGVLQADSRRRAPAEPSRRSA